MKTLSTTLAALAITASGAFADSPVVLNAVGTWSSLTNFQKHEEPFFNQRLAEASGGEIVGKIQSQSGLGLKGFEIMRLVKNGKVRATVSSKLSPPGGRTENDRRHS